MQDSLEDIEELYSENTETTCKSDSDRKVEPRLKRQRSESPTSNKRARPVPPLKSILAQTLLTSSSSCRSQGARESVSDTQTEILLRSSSPPNTLAKLLAQSPVSTLGLSQSCSLEAESNNAESNTSKPDDSDSVTRQMVRLLFCTKFLY